jgi:hypothetical protein
MKDKFKLILTFLKQYDNRICFKQKFISLFSAVLRLGVHNQSQKIIETKIIAEAIYQETYTSQNLHSKDDNKLYDLFYEWFTKQEVDEVQEMQASNSESENSNDSKNQITCQIHENTKIYSQQVEIIKSILNKFLSTRKYFQFNLLKTSEVIQIFKKFSLLGQMNKFQFISSVNEIFKKIELRGIKISESQKNDRISILLEILNFNYKPYDSFDLREILSSVCLLVSSSLDEFLSSMNDSNEIQDEIPLYDLQNYLENIFSFIIKLWDSKPYKNVSLSKGMSELITNEIISYYPELKNSKFSLKIKHLVDYCHYLYSI